MRLGLLCIGYIFCCIMLPSLVAAQCPVMADPVASVTDNNSCATPNGTITVTAPQPLSNYSFSIDGGSSYQANPVFSGLTGGTYQVLARSLSNPSCISAATATSVGGAAQFASTPFSISDATTLPVNNTITSAVVNLPNALYGIVFDIFRLDNAFNLKVNGVNIANDELQFYMPHPTGTKMEFTDGAQGSGSFYGGFSPTIVSAIWLLNGNAVAPLFRVVISNTGSVSIFGAKTSGGPLQPMRLRTGSFNTIPVNTTSNNTIQISQSIDFTTYAEGVFNQVVSPAMTATFSTTPSACSFSNSGTATVTVTGGLPPYNYVWSNGQTSAAATGLSNGGHAVTITDANQCQHNVNVIVGLTPGAFQRITIDQTICKGQNYFGYDTTGVYVDTLVETNGCTTIRTINLTVKSPVTVTVNQRICEGQVFLGHNATGTYTDTLQTAEGCDSIQVTNLLVLQRSTSSITQTICGGEIFEGHDTSGVYTDTLVAANGCDSLRTLILTVKPRSSSVISKDICQGQSYLGYNITGTYIDTLIAFNGCDSIRTLTLNVLSIPNPYLGADTQICSSSKLILHPGSFDNYVWQDASTQPNFTVTNPGFYNVVVTNICGSGNASILVTNKPCDVYIPNAFSPGGSSANKEFKILNGEIVTQLKLTVSNRYGQIIFETSNPFTGWDGTFKGKPQPAGTYVYYGEYRKNGTTRPIHFKGTVVLLR